MEARARVETLPCARLVTEGGAQARATLSETVIEEYAEARRHGDTFPPVDVYFDTETHWLADGWSCTRPLRIIVLPHVAPGARIPAAMRNA